KRDHSLPPSARGSSQVEPYHRWRTSGTKVHRALGGKLAHSASRITAPLPQPPVVTDSLNTT
ncbi:hypothetical protein, partial [Streptomonospora sp. PA3]|uniref:hypothetical protein n=1 Tax=Streptomonospora sp. PA3 TaxID=2607326 RepID=UPI001CA3DFEF